MDLSTAGAELLGGLLIGGAAAGLLLLNGRIAGFSNIAARVFSQQGAEWSWRPAGAPRSTTLAGPNDASDGASAESNA